MHVKRTQIVHHYGILRNQGTTAEETMAARNGNFEDGTYKKIDAI